MSFPAMLNPRAPLPRGAAYAVMFRDDDAIAWVPTIEGAVDVMVRLGIALHCDVVRVYDNRAVWPWFVKGGNG